MKAFDILNQYTLRFYKRWEHDEIDLAKCLLFKYDGTFIDVDIRSTTKKSLHGFLKKCFFHILVSKNNKEYVGLFFSKVKKMYENHFASSATKKGYFFARWHPSKML